MKAPDTVPGISIDVAELVAVRGKLGGMIIRDRRRAGYHSGARDIRVRGRGMEYEESRAYLPGDDVRTMDWRVMARTGEAYTKLFAEEKERRFLIAVDLSASMFFGTRVSFKSWAAAQVAAHVGWLAKFAGDRIGGLIVAPGFHHEIRPGKSRSGLLGVFHYLARASKIDLPPDNSQNRFNFLLRELKRVLKPGSIVALITDFIGVDDQTHGLLSAIARHNDINAYWIFDDTETRAWPDGHYPVASGKQIIGFDLTAGNDDSWLIQRQNEHSKQIRQLTSRLDVPLHPVCCNQDITAQVVNLRGL